MSNYPSYRKNPIYEDVVASQQNPYLPDRASGSTQVKQQIKNSLHETLEVLRRGKWLILGIFLFVLFGMVAFTWRQAPEYSAYSLLLLDPQGGGKEAEALNYGTIGGTGFDVRTQILILQQSLQIAERTGERLMALKTVPQTGEPIAILNDVYEQPRPLSELARVIQERHVFVNSEGDWRSGALRVTAVSAIAAEAALIANVYAEEYVKFSQETSRQRVAASRSFLEKQVEKRREELQQLSGQISAYMNREEAISPGEGTQVTVSQVIEMESALDDARLELAVKEASLRAFEAELQQLQPQLARRLEPNVTEEIDRSQKEIERLEGIVEPIYARTPALREDPGENEELRSLQQRIEQLKERVRELSGQYAEEMTTDGSATKEEIRTQVAQLNRQIIEHRILIDAAKTRIASLEGRLALHRQRLETVPGQMVQLAQLERARESVEQLYVNLAGKLQETRVAEESEVGFVRVVRPAQAPESPNRPNKAKNVMLGIILGLMLGVVAAIGRHWLDSRIYTPDDLKLRGLHMLGAIPDMSRQVKKEFGKQEKVTVDGMEVSTKLAPLLNPYSPTAEAYRHLYVGLQFRLSEQVLQTLLVTSPETEVGKSTTALNLALTTARASRRTLIIDADLRRPALHKYLGLRPTVGLKDLLNQQAVGWEQLATGIENLYALPVYESAANSAELLGSKEMRELLDRLKQAFDVIIFDTPPVLALTDAVMLSAHCDATIVVAAAGQTDGEGLTQTIHELKAVGARILGVVLNRFEPALMYKHTYGYRYQNYNKYYSSEAGS